MAFELRRNTYVFCHYHASASGRSGTEQYLRTVLAADIATKQRLAFATGALLYA